MSFPYRTVLSLTKRGALYSLLALLILGCGPGRRASAGREDGQITITLLQLNDIYEISPTDEGRSGGIARFATLRDSLQKQNPLTYTMLAGDFLSPSALGAIAMDNGQRIAGQHMLESLDAAGVDLVTFGNHEFDLSEKTLQERIDQSHFAWVSANVMHRKAPFVKISSGNSQAIPPTIVKEFTDADGTTARVGIFGLTINSTLRDYVQYTDYLESAAGAMKELEGKCDFVVALTHLQFRDDSILAVHFPGIKLIVGGHEHVNSYTKVGNVIIAKADANIKTVYVHELRYDKRLNDLQIKSQLVRIDETIREDFATKATVDKWNKLGYDLLSKKFNPCEIIATLPEPMDGTEEGVRSRETNLTRLIAQAIFQAPGQPTDCALFNSGAVRIDGTLKGNVTNYDLFRVLPFPGKIFIAGIRGSVLKNILQISDNSHGNGCFLQHVGIDRMAGDWMIGGKAIADDSLYRVAVNDFLISGNQERMTFLKNAIGDHVDSLKALPGLGLKDSNDWQQAVANYLKKTYPPKAAGSVKSNSLPCYN